MKTFFTKRACVLSIAIVLIMALTGMAVFAANGSKTLEAYYNNIKIYVDGAAITPTDVNGNSTEPFSVDGTVYVPIRAVSEALGKRVEWDGASNSVYVGAKPDNNSELYAAAVLDAMTIKAKANDLSEDDLAGVAGGVDLGMVGDIKVKTVVKSIVQVVKWFA